MKFITGDDYGVLRLISSGKKSVLEKYGEINQDNSIVKIFNPNEIIENEKLDNAEEQKKKEENNNYKLIITSKSEIYFLDWKNKTKLSSFKNTDKIYNINSTFKKTFTEQDNYCIINALSNNKINILQFSSNNKNNDFLLCTEFTPFESNNKNLNIKILNVIDSTFNKDSIYVCYKDAPLLLFNIDKGKTEFKSKNMPNDEYNLEVPNYYTDVCENLKNPRICYASTGQGEIRIFDKRASTRCSLNKKVTDCKINKILLKDENYIYFGDSKGKCERLDIRNNFACDKNFKGDTASVKEIIDHNDTLVVGGLGKFVRWFNYDSGESEQVFIQSNTNSMCVMEIEPKQETEENEMDEEGGEVSDSEFNEEEDEQDENEEKESDECSEDINDDIEEEEIESNGDLEESELDEEEESEESKNKTTKEKQKNKRKKYN